jgi:hypothetical protein
VVGAGEVTSGQSENTGYQIDIVLNIAQEADYDSL